MPATAADAQVIMQLYDLRREPEMRKARAWFGAEFNPKNVDDLTPLFQDMRSDANRYFRMVTSYWEMAASMVLHGAINEELFLDSQQEFFFVFAKVTPVLQGLREKLGSPEAMGKSETLINKSDASKKKLQVYIERIQRFQAMAAAAAQKK